MTTRLGRRALAGVAALLPAAGFIEGARAQSANESTFDRIRRTKILRIAALPGELPYFQKDLASGEPDLAHRNADSPVLDVDPGGIGKGRREIRGLERRQRGASSHGVLEDDYSTRAPPFRRMRQRRRGKSPKSGMYVRSA